MTGRPLLIELPGGGTVLFSERAHGNASSVGGAGREDGALVRERLRELAGVRALARGYQVHGTTVQRVRVPPRGEQPPDLAALGVPHAAGEAAGETTLALAHEAAHAPALETATLEQRQPATANGHGGGYGTSDPDAHADGQATALRLIGTTVLTADCLPVALGGQGAVAMVHAGWRGLAAGVLEEGVRAARELGAVAPTHAVIGPGAGLCCYEVGEEVHDAFGGAHRRGRHIDLRAIARERLLEAGVREVIDLELCTICDERFFSHRREGERAGRQAAITWLS